MAISSVNQNFHSVENGNGGSNKSALFFLTMLFFMWGFLTCLNDILIPHLKSLFNMGYTQTMLIQFTFFGAYAIMSIPASYVIGKIGYQKGIVLGLTVAGIGAFLFYPASIVISYGVFLFAFFTLATGITILQVAANPFVAILGNPETASGRLTLTQAFNSLGTTIAPILGAVLILGGSFFVINQSNVSQTHLSDSTAKVWTGYGENALLASEPIENYAKDTANHLWFYGNNQLFKYDGESVQSHATTSIGFKGEVKGIVEEDKGHARIIYADDFQSFRKAKAKTVQLPYISLGLILLLIAAIFLMIKLPVISSARPSGKAKGNVLKYRHLTLGAIAIFVYVGAEVSIGSFLVNFFGERNIAGLKEQQAAKFVALYWGGAMIGRFLGAIAMGGIPQRAKRQLLMLAALVFGYFVSWYITGSTLQAAIFSIFTTLNALASALGQNKAPRTLALFAAAAVALVTLTIFTGGHLAMWSIIAVGLFNSIMFPTIFTLAIDKLGEFTSQGSGVLNTAIVGGAIIPLIMGAFADTMGIQKAFIITLVCYAYIFYYAVWGYKVRHQ